MKLLYWIPELLFPRKCVLCGQLLEKNETDICHTCLRENESWKNGKEKISFVASCTVLWYYKGNIRNSLLRFKFSGRRSYAGAYARQLALKLSQQEELPDLITWVPIHPSKLRRRGYDQVELIARELSRELGVEAVCTVRKIRKNRTQSTLSGTAERKANVLGVYSPVHQDWFYGKKILLLDDIITTGATMSECARVLMTFGAARVDAAAVAAASHQSNSR